jgi:hypothetical protein
MLLCFHGVGSGAAFRSRARVPMVSLSVSLVFGKPAPLQQQVLGEKSVGEGGAILAAEGSMVGLC